LANAPYDDESVGEEEAREIAAARASFARGEGIPHEEVLREFGLNLEDWERMGRTPLETIAFAFTTPARPWKSQSSSTAAKTTDS